MLQIPKGKSFFVQTQFLCPEFLFNSQQLHEQTCDTSFLKINNFQQKGRLGQKRLPDKNWNTTNIKRANPNEEMLTPQFIEIVVNLELACCYNFTRFTLNTGYLLMVASTADKPRPFYVYEKKIFII